MQRRAKLNPTQLVEHSLVDSTQAGSMLIGSILVGSIQAAHATSLLPVALRFHKACREPERAQAKLLRKITTEAATSAFGKEHSFSRNISVLDYQRRVPVRDYASMEPWITRLELGERGVLTQEPLLAFEPSSGTTSGNKLIPYTRGLLADFSRATGPWLFDLLSRRPKLLGTRSYWSVSAASRWNQRTAGGIRIGLEDDTEYFAPWQRWAILKTLAVSPNVARESDVAKWRHRTALELVAARDLGFVSVWHPSFFTLLLEYIEQQWPTLLAELTPTRRQELELVTASNGVRCDVLWPELQLISCWTSGPAAEFLPELRKRCPGPAIQGKGLMATEGVVSIPLGGAREPVAAVTSHFLEFVDVESPSRPALLLHQLKVGARYRPLLTTSGGLYRYDLGDCVEVAGYYYGVPQLTFVGRLDQRSDLRGEKLTAAQVDAILERSCQMLKIVPRFLLLAPTRGGTPSYCLFIEAEALGEATRAELGRRVEALLCDSYHYNVCRTQGQLAPLRVVSVNGAFKKYQQRRALQGMKLGDIKPTRLAKETFWYDVLTSQGDVNTPSVGRTS